MTKLGEYFREEDRDGIFILLKFSKREYLEMIQKGKLYMNNFEYFINLERETGIKGQGDKLEAANVMNDMILQVLDPGSHDIVGELEASQMHFRPDYMKYIPIFCMTYIGPNDIEIIEESQEQMNAVINLNEDLRSRITQEFGEHVLVISPNEFIKKVMTMAERENLALRAGKVNYSNLSINDKERFDEFHSGNPALYFRKDKSFEYQNEFRLVLHGEHTKKPVIKDIGDISEVSKLMTVDQLLNNKIQVTFNRRNNGRKMTEK
ncbi:hypothetical protein [Pontibacillus salipaludis]|uniref:Uncharacterized protein n=1 Tax=Pontibacillus salipaludis TaxID=1697394 RepID=A0ABQ1PIE9_9BACI|nr:hypothetical protein [Pontibacillus salipaludis]GGC97807.1 hypothetical protein GCM10011389_01170 [Pontibacillus salipaludis]